MSPPMSVLMLSSMFVALLLCLRAPKTWPLRKLLILSIALGLLTESLGALLRQFVVLNSVVFNIYEVLEFLVVLWLVHAFRPAWRRPLIGLAVLGVLVFAVNAFVHSPLQFLLVEAAIVTAMLLCLVLVAALWHLANTSALALHRVPDFWLFMGLLIYFGGMIPVVSMVRFVFQEDAVLAARLFAIMPVLCVLRYLFIIASCLMARAGRSAHG